MLKCSKVLSINGEILTRSAIHQKVKAQESRNKKGHCRHHNRKNSEEEELLPPIQTKELHIWDHPISKLYTDYCERFPIRSRSGNEYTMIAYHFD